MNEVIKTKRQSSAVQAARVERVLEIATDDEIKKIEKNFTFLATVGSTAGLIASPTPHIAKLIMTTPKKPLRSQLFFIAC